MKTYLLALMAVLCLAARLSADIVVDGTTVIRNLPKMIGGLMIEPYEYSNLRGFTDTPAYQVAFGAIAPPIARHTTYPDYHNTADANPANLAAYHDPAVDKIVAYGSTPLFLFYTAPNNSTTNSNTMLSYYVNLAGKNKAHDGVTDANLATNVVFLVSHYLGLDGGHYANNPIQTQYWEIGNEPDNTVNGIYTNPNGKYTWADYCNQFNSVDALLRATSDGHGGTLRDHVVICGPALAQEYAPTNGCDALYRAFFAACVNTGACDIFTRHKYSGGTSTTTKAAYLNVGRYGWADFDASCVIDTNAGEGTLQRLMAECGVPTRVGTGITEFNTSPTSLMHSLEQGIWTALMHHYAIYNYRQKLGTAPGGIQLSGTAAVQLQYQSMLTTGFIFDGYGSVFSGCGYFTTNPAGSSTPWTCGDYNYWASYIVNQLAGGTVLKQSYTTALGTGLPIPLVCTATVDNQYLYVQVINRYFDASDTPQPLTETIDLTNFPTLGAGTVYTLSGSTNNLPLNGGTTGSQAGGLNPSFSYTFPALSITIFKFPVLYPPPVINSSLTAVGTKGVGMSYTITATNNPLSFAATGLPDGLSLATTTGVISGTPTTTGTFSASISASNTQGSGSATVVFTVLPPLPVINSALSVTGTINAPLSYSITATNSPTSFGATGLPDGLSVNAAGVISGTPTTTGTFSSIVSATNAYGSGSATLVFNVLPPLPVITSELSVTGTTGAALSYQVTALNSPSSYAATGLPDGLSINPTTGVISGTTTTAGTFIAGVSATNVYGSGSASLVFIVIPPAPVITSALAVTGTTGFALNYAITATNTPTNFDATGLPDGLNVDTDAGTISGTPTAAGTFPTTITASNEGGTSTATVVFTVILAKPVITSSTAVTGTTGTAFNYTIVAINSPTSFGATNLPAGLSIDTTTGIISGTPTLKGTYTTTIISASNAVGTGTASLKFSLLPGIPVITSGLAVTGTISSPMSYTITATNTPISYTATGLPTGLSIVAATGVISGTPTATGTFSTKIVAGNAGGSGSATVVFTVLPLTPTINSALSVTGTATETLSYTITASCNPTSYAATGLPAGLSINTATGVISGTLTTTGTYSSTISATNAVGAGSATVVFAVLSPNPVITSGLAVTGTTDATVNYTITATNNPSSYGATGLPDGLSIDTATGIISGTPTTVGTYSSTITATNAKGSGSATLVFTVVPPYPVITSGTTAKGNAGSALSYTITAINNPTSFGATKLPAGLSVDTTTGVISGTPTLKGTYSSTISASNAKGTGTSALVFTILPTPPVITSALSVTGTVSTALSYTVTAANAPSGFTATGLPAGLSLATGSSGLISGTPTTTGTFSTKIVASNSGGSGTATVVFTVLPLTPVINSALIVTGTSGAALSYTITASCNPTSYAATGLPSGLSVDPAAGVISGTPTTTGTYSSTVSATNAVGSGSATVVFTVLTSPPAITSALTVTGTTGTALSYTITATNSPTSYAATGLPAGLSINTTTGLISGTATLSGTSNISLSASNAGGTGMATLILTLRAPFVSWQNANFTPAQLSNSAISGDMAAPAGDGIANLMKYALNLNPMTNAAAGLPVEKILPISGSNYLTLSYTHVKAATDITYIVELSGDMKTWNSGDAYTTQVGVTDKGATETVVVRDVQPVNSSTKRFIRLKISKP